MRIAQRNRWPRPGRVAIGRRCPYVRTVGRRSGALFNSRAQAILPSAGLTDAHVHAFLAASQALVARTQQAQPA